jgi:two-component system CheB/CheR fusion protein
VRRFKGNSIDSGMAFVLVQHLDPNHESILTEILQNPLQFLFEIADDIKVEQSYLCYPQQ